MSTVIIGSAVGAMLFLAGRKMWKDKKAGKSSCGGNCAGCSGCCSSRREENK